MYYLIIIIIQITHLYIWYNINKHVNVLTTNVQYL